MHTNTLDEPLIAGIANRLRDLLQHRPAFRASIAEELGIPTREIDRLLFERDNFIDTGLLIDLVTILVRQDAIDPHWLLTGEYDLEIHRTALNLVEDCSTRRSPRRTELRTFVEREWTKRQNATMIALQFRRAS